MTVTLFICTSLTQRHNNQFNTGHDNMKFHTTNHKTMFSKVLWVISVLVTIVGLSSAVSSTAELANACPASARSLTGSKLMRKRCWALGDPPYIKHGKFRSVEFMRCYPLTPTFFKGLEPPSSFDALLPMLNKLASGGRVDIVLIGG